MKTLVRISVFFLFINMGLLMSPNKASAMQPNFSFQLFYDQLSPYGTWINNPDFGFVWLPEVGPGFSPYATDGHWEFTDYGWTWVSDFAWGWAPFHYGRWYDDPYYGAMWVPDTEWGPAWVSWRQADGYFGWAPMAPGININMTFGRNYQVPNERWIFVRDRDFCRHDVNRYYVNQTNNYTIINNSTVIINSNVDNSRHVRYATGPDRNEVQRRTHSVIRPLSVRENGRPGHSINNDQLTIYRPNVKNDRTAGNRPAPSKVARMQDVQSKTARNARQQDNQRSQQTAGNVNKESNQRSQQTARNASPANDQRNQQSTRNVNTQGNQRSQQPVRNLNNESNQRSQQPAGKVNTQVNQRSQQPASKVNTQGNQRSQQPERNVNAQANQRSQQSARNVNTQGNQRSQQSASNVNTQGNQRSQQPARNVNSSEKRSDNQQPVQSASGENKDKQNGRHAKNAPR